jgi:hypothetical protein
MTPLEFLGAVYPHGPWALTAISPDCKSLDTQTFFPRDQDLLVRWLDHNNHRNNLYWHVNPVIRPVTRKAERTDIARVCYLHVDIDPRPGADLTQEQARILGLFRFPPGGIARPSVIVFSGGGYQAFWRLVEPIEINGDLVRAEEAARYNQQLEAVFGADACHNIDRIMRLPGTMNLPNAKKRKAGRTPVLAQVIEMHLDRVYPLSQFTPAPLLQTGTGGFSNDGEDKPSFDSVKRLESVEDLKHWNVPDRILVIIVQGKYPDEIKPGDDSRSAWLFDVVCNLIRCNVPDEVIYSVITDPGFGISASVLETGASANRYAMRQIERAHEEVIDPWLRKLNEQFAVIGNTGGKCRVIEEVEDPVLRRSRLSRQTFEDFNNRHLNKTIEIGKDKEGRPISVPVGRWWLKHPLRRQFNTIVFAPGRIVPGAYNLWKGFAVTPRPGDCGLFLTHVRENICSGNDDYYNYLIGWMAMAVQHPDSPGQVGVVLRGGRGVGKSIFAKQFGSLFGRHFIQVSDPKHLVGSFNAHLRDVVVLFGDEAFYAGDKKHESVLKTLITEEQLTIEHKGVDVETGPNFTHVILASNSDWVVPAGADERRFFVLDVAPTHKQNHAYFAALVDQMAHEGASALLYQLLNHPLEGFQVRVVPQTPALKEQKLLSLTPEEEWWYRKLQSGRLLDDLSHVDEWPEKVAKFDLLEDYVGYMRRIATLGRRANETTLGKFMRRMCPGICATQALGVVRVPGVEPGWTNEVTRRIYYWWMPPLDVCREHWVSQFGISDFTTPELPLKELPAEEQPPM